MKKIIGRIIGFPFLVVGVIAFVLGYYLLLLGYAPVFGFSAAKQKVNRHLLNIEDQS